MASTEHDHAHDHEGHEHDHADEVRAMALTNRRRLLVVMVAGIAIMALEIVGGVLANSLVLLADAAHYATDVVAVGIAFLAVTLAMRPATLQKTFGYRRAEVLAALLNAAALWGVSALFLYEAWRRLQAPPEVGGRIVMLVGGFSLVANAALAFALSRGSGHNLNMRAAYLHILSDVLGSAAALVAGAGTFFFGWRWADPVSTVVVTLLILVFTWRLTRDTLNILLQATPASVDMGEVERAIRDVAAVKEVHELHLWSLTQGSEVLSVHVVLDAPPQGDAVTHDIHEALKTRFRIDHVTVQVESPECPCTSARCAPEPSSRSSSSAPSRPAARP